MSRLLVTNCTPPRAGVYLLDTGRRSVTRLHDRPTRGITEGPDGYYFVEHRGAVFHLEPDTWRVTHRMDTGFQGCHDLRWIEDAFYLVASYGNRVARYDPKLRVLDELRIVEDEGDVCHANCLVESGGELLLSVFTLSPGRREDKRTTDDWRRGGKILRLDWERKDFEVLYEPLSQPHSLVPLGDALYCCESYSSELSVISLAGRTKKRLRRLRGFVRGLALQGDRAFVGISRTKDPTPPGRWARLRERILSRLQFRCGILVMDARTWRVRERHRIPGTEVYDLIVLD